MSDLIVKAAADVSRGDDDEGSPHGTFVVALSTPTEDREGESVKADEWEPLPDHVTFDIDHGMSVASTVGSGVPSLDDSGRLIVHGTYASRPLAQETRQLVNEGHIRSVSVAFLRKTIKGVGGESTIRRELLNGAFVAVPMNADALVLNSKSLDDAITREAQQAHDRAVLLGAHCAKQLDDEHDDDEHDDDEHDDDDDEHDDEHDDTEATPEHDDQTTDENDAATESAAAAADDKSAAAAADDDAAALHPVELLALLALSELSID